jgi:cysteinyl-tRNA synthetase
MHALRQASGRKALAGTLAFFGFRGEELKQWQQSQVPTIAVAPIEVETMISARNAARAAKDWAESDRIRDELVAMGIKLTDSKEGTTWEVAR